MADQERSELARTLEAFLAMEQLRQREDEPFFDFLERFEAVESGDPNEYSERYKVHRLLVKLKKDLRVEVTRGSLPKTRMELIERAHLFEIMMKPRTNTSLEHQ